MKAGPNDVGILVVDDDPSIRLILTESFVDAGFRVDEADEPFIAFQKLAQAHFDIIFSDIHMPGITGIELLREIKQANSEAIVVIMTADAALDTAIEATKLGAVDYLRKPFASLAEVVALAQRLATRVREQRAKSEAVGALLSVAKTLSASSALPAGVGDVAAIAAKAERLLGVHLSQEKDRTDPNAPTFQPTAGATTAAELNGELADFPLPEILQLLGMMRKTGILRIKVPVGLAAVAFSGGSVNAVQFGAATDLKAMFRLCLHQAGTFNFKPTPQPPTAKRIEQSTEWILMESMRHLDELAALGPARPPADLLVRYAPPVGATAPVDELEKLVADQLREPKVISSLLDAIPHPDLDILQALIRLRRAKSIELLGRRPAAASA